MCLIMWSKPDNVLSLCKSGAKSRKDVTHYDFILATGKTWIVRGFVEMAFACIGKKLECEDSSVDVSSCNKGTGKVLMHANFRFFHLAEMDLLISDTTKT